MALKAEPGSAAGTFRYYAETIDKVYGQIAPTADNILALILREPVGVVAAIVPWNFPLMIGSWKIAPALAAGNSIGGYLGAHFTISKGERVIRLVLNLVLVAFIIKLLLDF